MANLSQEEYADVLKRMGANENALRSVKRVMGNAKTIAKGRIPKPKMTSVEAEYAEKLAAQQRGGSIVWWRFECITLILKDFDTTEQCVRYTPDFCVMLEDGTIQFIETKGPYRYEDSWIKLKIAASLYPFQFLFAQRGKDKQWTIKAV